MNRGTLRRWSTWLANAHQRLDAAFAAVHGQPSNPPDDELLAQLFSLNQERAGVAASTMSD